MKRSEFRHAVDYQFGPLGVVLLRDLVIPALGNRTAQEALDAGVEPQRVWDYLCAEQNVPGSQRVAVRLPQLPSRHG